MRYSKPSFCIAVLTLFVTGKSLSQVQIETKIGLSIAGMHWVDGGEKVNIKTASGILLGAKIDFGLSNRFKLSTGLEIVGKGGSQLKFDTVYFRPAYLQIPLQFCYRQDGFYAGAGPYLGIGIGGRFKYQYNGKFYDFPLYWNADQDAIYQRVDIGGTLEAGYQIRHLRFSASYNFSLINNSSLAFRDQHKILHRNAAISLGYVWGKAPTKAFSHLQHTVKAGLNLSDMAISVNGKDTDIKILPGFLIGWMSEFGLSKNLGLGLGLELSQKGGVMQQDVDTTYFYPIYLQIPVQVFFHHRGFFVGAGPYLGLGVGGRVNTKVANNIHIDQVKFDNTLGAHFNQTDFGGSFVFGYQFGHLNASASYNLSLVNNAPKIYGDTVNIRHRVIGIAFGYVFVRN